MLEKMARIKNSKKRREKKDNSLNFIFFMLNIRKLKFDTSTEKYGKLDGREAIESALEKLDSVVADEQQKNNRQLYKRRYKNKFKSPISLFIVYSKIGNNISFYLLNITFVVYIQDIYNII